MKYSLMRNNQGNPEIIKNRKGDAKNKEEKSLASGKFFFWDNPLFDHLWLAKMSSFLNSIDESLQWTLLMWIYFWLIFLKRFIENLGRISISNKKWWKEKWWKWNSAACWTIEREWINTSRSNVVWLWPLTRYYSLEICVIRGGIFNL